MKINDLVLMVHVGKSYSGYFEFFEKYNLPIDMASRYVYYESPKFHGVYRVLFSVSDEFGNKVVIEEIGMSRRVYIVEENALVKIGKICDNYLEITEEHYKCMGFGHKEEI